MIRGKSRFKVELEDHNKVRRSLQLGNRHEFYQAFHRA
jgi:hypothetical protein